MSSFSNENANNDFFNNNGNSAYRQPGCCFGSLSLSSSSSSSSPSPSSTAGTSYSTSMMGIASATKTKTTTTKITTASETTIGVDSEANSAVYLDVSAARNSTSSKQQQQQQGLNQPSSQKGSQTLFKKDTKSLADFLKPSSSSSNTILGGRRNKKSTQPTATTSTTETTTTTTATGEVSSILAKELNDLTFQERERIFEEVHGITSSLAATQIDETPEFVKDKIRQLQMELSIDNSQSTIVKSKRRAFDRALFLKPSLLQDEKFMKMFLRADNYDVPLTAQRMVMYFTYKLEMFGDDKLVKDITLEDMTEDDMEAISTGAVQILKEKDTAGRPVVFIAQMHYKYKYWENQLRYLWYQKMVTLEDEDAQINGLVDIIYCVSMSEMESSFSQLMAQGGHMLTKLPFRISALHFCYNDKRLIPALSLIQIIVGRSTRLRFRTHFGSHLEVQYALMTFGIPIKKGKSFISTSKSSSSSLPNESLLPIKLQDGQLKKEMNQQYLQQRRKIETQRKNLEYEKEQQRRRRQQQQPAKKKKEKKQMKNNKNNPDEMTIDDCTMIIEYPNPMDVLLGRGRPYQEFTGNLQMVTLVKQQYEKYQSIQDRFEKASISLDIVRYIQSKGGRFIQRIPNLGWKEIDDLTARDKISHTFRTITTQTLKTSKTTKSITTKPASGLIESNTWSSKKVDSANNAKNYNKDEDDNGDKDMKRNENKRIKYDNTALLDDDASNDDNNDDDHVDEWL